MRDRVAGVIAASLFAATAASAQIAVSSEDGKQLTAGETPQSRTADGVSIVRIDRGTVTVLGRVTVPTSMIGPPRSIALSSDGRTALVTAAQRLDAGSPPTLVANASVSVIDLRQPSKPRVVQTLAAGAGATGIALDRAGSRVLVANAGADSVSVFRRAGGRLQPVGTVALDPGSKPVSVDFLPDGRAALVVAQTAGTVVRLDIAGDTVTRRAGAIAACVSPYSIAVDAAGAYAYVGCLGGSAPGPQPSGGRRIGTVIAIDIAAGSVAQSVDAGVTPEHVALSPGGGFLAVTLINGSNALPDAPAYRDHGLLRVYAVEMGRLRPVAEARTGRWCQGLAWSSDERHLVVQCAALRQLESYGFDGRTLTPMPTSLVQLQARPGAIATPQRR